MTPRYGRRGAACPQETNVFATTWPETRMSKRCFDSERQQTTTHTHPCTEVRRGASAPDLGVRLLTTIRIRLPKRRSQRPEHQRTTLDALDRQARGRPGQV